jgi:23S rRNA (cytosine1962-C5)-methyltransferase
VETVHGEAPQPLQVREGELTLHCDLLDGQKTGWFYDHRDNREQLRYYAKDAEVLDVYSYVGAWALQALHFGAKSVTAVDSSARALELLKQNAERNGFSHPDTVTCMHGDALEQLRQLQQDKRRFDVIVLDPPAFIKRKKDLKKGSEAYQQINNLAMKLLRRGGILISASCSYHLSEIQLKDILLRAARHAGKHGEIQLQILQQGFQSRDHPWHPAISETRYLKCYICRVL